MAQSNVARLGFFISLSLCCVCSLVGTVACSRTSTKNANEFEVEAGDLKKGMWVERNEHLDHGKEPKGKKGPYNAGGQMGGISTYSRIR